MFVVILVNAAGKALSTINKKYVKVFTPHLCDVTEASIPCSNVRHVLQCVGRADRSKLSALLLFRLCAFEDGADWKS